MKRRIPDIIFILSFGFVIWFLFQKNIDWKYRVIGYFAYAIIVSYYAYKTEIFVDENGKEIKKCDRKEYMRRYDKIRKAFDEHLN